MREMEPGLAVATLRKAIEAAKLDSITVSPCKGYVQTIEKIKFPSKLIKTEGEPPPSEPAKPSFTKEVIPLTGQELRFDIEAGFEAGHLPERLGPLLGAKMLEAALKAASGYPLDKNVTVTVGRHILYYLEFNPEANTCKVQFLLGAGRAVPQ